MFYINYLVAIIKKKEKKKQQTPLKPLKFRLFCRGFEFWQADLCLLFSLW